MITEKLKKAYKKKYGTYPKGWHLHHLKPVYMGGTDDLTNLIAVSPKRHAAMHTYLFETKGDVRDRDAATMILSDGVQPIDPVELGGVDTNMFKGAQAELDQVDMSKLKGKSTVRNGHHKPQYTNYYSYANIVINDEKNNGFDTIIVIMRNHEKQFVGILYVYSEDANIAEWVEL